MVFHNSYTITLPYLTSPYSEAIYSGLPARRRAKGQSVIRFAMREAFGTRKRCAVGALIFQSVKVAVRTVAAAGR